MSAMMSLPPEIQRTTTFGDGAVYVFPRRDLRGWRWIAVVPIVGSLFFLVFLAIWTWGFVGGLVGIFGPWGYLAVLVVLPGLAAVAAGIGIGLVIAWGHTEIHVIDNRIRYGERVGPFFWKKTVPREQITRLVVQGAESTPGEAHNTIELLAGMAALKAEVSRGKPRWLAVCYPRDWLLAVASQLAGGDDAIAFSKGESEPLPVVSILPSDLATGDVDRFDQPSGSTIERQELPGGFTLVIPAVGVWKGSAGLFSFSLFWCGFMTVFTGVVGFIFATEKPPEEKAIWIFGIVIVLFWCVGIAMLLGAINMGRRQAAIAVTADRLKLIESGLFGVKRREWRLDELQTARKGRSGMEVNDRPVMQLHIVPHDGSPYGMLTGRDEAELEWIATELRSAIQPASVPRPANNS